MTSTKTRTTTKTATKTAAKNKQSSSSSHPTYETMISQAIVSLKERSGSSRPALKKYIFAKYNLTETPTFLKNFNAAIRRGMDKEVFNCPKGINGSVKLAPKKAKSTSSKAGASTSKVAPAKKAAVTKKAAPAKANITDRKPPTKRTVPTERAAPAKKAAPTKKSAGAKRTPAVESASDSQDI